MWSPAYQELADICVPNLQEYCDKHGYELRNINARNNDCWFRKHQFFNDVFESTKEDDIIFYCDVDTLITNHNIKIEQIVLNEPSVFITKDFNELNGGSIILRCDRTGRLINQYILSQKENFQNEQNVYNSSEFKIRFGSSTCILQQNTINSYSYDLYPECREYIGRNDLGDWANGDFLIHFPGLGINDRIELMKEFKEKIIK